MLFRTRLIINLYVDLKRKGGGGWDYMKTIAGNKRRHIR